ncbi:class F sortase [Streptomyces sp. NPDC059166]|uniref:class F sortase n=1 Tax=Streptomyces sp. NPDC059166 TaxID=3346752 RepID=UPI0036B2D93B
METGRSTSTSTTPPSSFPAVKHLVWALVAGTALVAAGLRDETPERPPAAGAAAAPRVLPEAPLPGHDPSATSASLRPVVDYFAPDRVPAEPPALVRRSTAPPVLRPVGPVRTAPLVLAPPSPEHPERPGSRPAGSGAATPAPSPHHSTRPSPHGARPLPVSTPLRLRIPSAKVDAPMMELDLDATGALEPPPDNNPVLAGWYAGGTVPGAVGTAVVAGHVDTRLGPGVFRQLDAVRKGATIEVVRADQRTAVFTVYAVEVYDKKNFPDEKVYGRADRAELRVITCGGAFTKKAGYEDNVVVFAALTGTR